MSDNHTKELVGKKARHALLKGAGRVYTAVSTTLGPRGRNVIVNKGYDIEVLHDGVKVSRYVAPKNKHESAGAVLLREAAEKHVASVGDGTTLTTILGYHIVKEAMTLIDSGIDAMALPPALEKGRDIIISEIKKLAKPIKTKKQKIQVASISAHDPYLGELIGSIYHKIGLDGVIVADDGGIGESTVEHEEGISISNGYLSPYFINNPQDMTANVRNSYILITDRELDDVYEFLDFVEKVLKPKKIRNLTVIAGDVKGTLLAAMIDSKKKGMMNFLAIKAPSFGAYRKELLDDIAVMTGGKFIEDDSQKRLGELEFDDLGYASFIKAKRESTTIRGNKGSLKEIRARVKMIKNLIKKQDKEFDSEKLQERLSKITGGVYVIRTGGSTELEIAERKERVDDAILATKSAIISGIVPGGEITFLKAREALKPTNDYEEYAYRILTRAIEEPFKKLLKNAALDPGYFMAKLEDRPFGWGVDVIDGEIKNMIREGIIDPADVLIEGLRSAVSVAILMLTGDVAIALYVKKQKPPMP